MELIESIRVSNRHLENIEKHNERFNKSRNKLFGLNEQLDLNKIIKIPTSITRSVHKCRIVYDKEIRQIEFIPYFPKKIKSIELINDNKINYSHKYTDRTHLIKLRNNSPANEIIIVKNGLLTDASYANICLFDGAKWFTPTLPLLEGTMRAKLLNQHKIHLADIRPSDIHVFKKIKLINAMLIFENTRPLDIDTILK